VKAKTGWLEYKMKNVERKSGHEILDYSTLSLLCRLPRYIKFPASNGVLGPCSRYRARQPTSRRHHATLQCDSCPKAAPELAPPSDTTASRQQHNALPRSRVMSLAEICPSSVGDGPLKAASHRKTKACLASG
jgi:hypothetical protein